MSQNTPSTAVPHAQQWVSTTSGRIVTDTYSWLQAVHWVHGTGAAPVPAKGPKFGPTTLQVAQELTKLTEVRPGVAYLARVLKVSERTVQYHLAHLRNTGLLAYVEVGTRLPRTEDRTWVERRTSHFALTIPAGFDEALGIRTAGEGPTRRMVGITAAGRTAIGRLGKLATKAVRRRRKKAAASRTRCTPMVGGSVLPSVAHSPSASRLEGERRIGSTKKADRGHVRNKVGRRFQLAAELRKRVLWLTVPGRRDQRQAVERLAWVLSEVSDAGWTVSEVEAWLALIDEPEHVRRPSGLVASRLRTALLLWADPAVRARGVENHRDRVRANAKARAEISPDAFAGAVEAGVASRIVAGVRGGQARLAASQRARGEDDLSGGVSASFGTGDDAVDARFAAFLGGAL
ncbi:hypothetical protein [Kitasatospora sp. NPDC090091]|uniref:hypothetical protein n=1 Tax=Kitasatospora sp. NPDC090091 TaxID=3364081 RepID=UPI00382057E5